MNFHIKVLRLFLHVTRERMPLHRIDFVLVSNQLPVNFRLLSLLDAT
jgi:hypothetical protein